MEEFYDKLQTLTDDQLRDIVRNNRDKFKKIALESADLILKEPACKPESEEVQKIIKMKPTLKNLNEIEEREVWPGFHGRLIHTATMTFAFWRVEKGASIHEHQHIHEQVVNMHEGEFELVVNGQAQICKPGDVFVIPSNVPHSGVALTECRILDVFQPVRTDYVFED